MNAGEEGTASAPGATVTVFTKHAAESEAGSALLSKRIALIDGRIVSDGSPCLMAISDAEVMDAATAPDLAGLIAGMSSANALALGCIKSHEKARVVTASALANRTETTTSDGWPVIARSRQYIDYHSGPAWLLIDFDRKEMPDAVADKIEAAGGAWPALLSVAPGLARAARVSRSSTSAALSRSDNGEEVATSGGEHHYILVRDGSDVDRALTMLHERCRLAGFSWFHVGKSGQLLDGSLIDSTVRFGERLIFEGPPEVIPPLIQDAAARLPVPHDGDAIDTRSVIPDLNAFEIACTKQTKDRDRALLEPIAAEVRAKADRQLAEGISKRTGIPFVSAARAVAARHRSVLLPDVMLDFDHLGRVTVEAVLAHPDNYVGETLADPLEGIEYGRCQAMVLRTDAGAMFINSFAHGGATYALRHDLRTAQRALENADPRHLVDVFCVIMQHAEIEVDERAVLIAAAGAQAGVGVRAIEARLKAEQAKSAAAGRDKSRDQMRARDSRPTRTLPPSDAERGPIIRLVDDAFAADMSEEPPMRDADGAIVAVKERVPWGLHLLTATGSNAEATANAGDAGDKGDGFSPSAPPEPMIVRLSPVEVELLIESFIRLETPETEKKPSYPAALQRPFIDALMAMGNASKMPVVRAINTAPWSP